jgi:serine/threonine protein kinase
MPTDPYPDFIRYKILGVLGRGSMGTVYKAHHLVLGRIVALKVPQPALIHHDKSAERFLREARAMGMLDHPNIVKVYDADVEGNAPFIAMEYIEGPTITEYIRRKSIYLSRK